MTTSEHLNWHKDEQEYVHAKSQITKFQTIIIIILFINLCHYILQMGPLVVVQIILNLTIIIHILHYSSGIDIRWAWILILNFTVRILIWQLSIFIFYDISTVFVLAFVWFLEPLVSNSNLLFVIWPYILFFLELFILGQIFAHIWQVSWIEGIFSVIILCYCDPFSYIFVVKYQ